MRMANTNQSGLRATQKQTDMPPDGAALMNEIEGYWRAINKVLKDQGHLKQKGERGLLIPTAQNVLVLPDRVIFHMDTQRLAGISYKVWQDTDLWKLWRGATEGRLVFVSNGAGLAITVAREPGAPRERVPDVIPLEPKHMPDEAYHVCLGYDGSGPVLLDVADRHRAILVGSTSGFGKTTLMKSVVLQLAHKHTPDEFRVAIVDPKEVDFGPHTVFARLPHLFEPGIAYDLEDGERLIRRVEAEMLRRKALMAAAGVTDWRDYRGCEGERTPDQCLRLPLLLLVVDEVADFAGNKDVMGDKDGALVHVARKGRSFGIGMVVGTQHPTTRVINAQIKANLPTAIALRTKGRNESQVILDRSGAERLHRKGLALVFLDEWRKVQTLKVDDDVAEALVVALVDGAAPRRASVGCSSSALSDIETALVRYAMEALDGAFIVNRLYDAFQGEISKRKLTELAQRWERRGWLTEPSRDDNGYKQGRCVTDELLALCPAPDTKNGDVVTSLTSGDMASERVT